MERIYKWFTDDNPEKETTGLRLSWFTGRFEPQIFSGIECFMLCYLRYCAKLSVLPKKEYLAAYMKIDGMQDVKKYNIKTDTMSAYDYREMSQLTEAYKVIQTQASATWDIYMNQDLTDRSFKVDIYDFMASKKADIISDKMLQTYTRMNDGSNVTEVSKQIQYDLANVE